MAYLDHYLEARSERLHRKGSKPRHIIKGERRRHVIDKTMDVLKDWRLSHFENQGAVHAGLRSALCIDGYSWAKSDSEAQSIVAESLRMIGAKYPTWEQGQREYTVPRENCAQCGGAMPEEANDGLRQERFCSTECAKAAWIVRSQNASWKNSNVSWAAYRMVLKTRTTPRQCSVCEKTFSVVRQLSDARYCSKACSNIGRLKRAQRPCGYCEEPFQPVRATSKYCCLACKNVANGLRMRRPSNVIYLTAEVFDGWFKRAA